MKPIDPNAEILEAMEAVEPRNATQALDHRIQTLKRKRSDGLDLKSMGLAFRQLLQRRGYFTLIPEDLERSLQDIAMVGVGFDCPLQRPEYEKHLKLAGKL